MPCPHCGADAAATTLFCPHCGKPLQASAPLAPDATTVPLTAEQLTWLRANTVLPVIILALVLGGIALIFSCFFGRFLDSPFIRIFLIVCGALLLVVAVLVGMHIRNNRADARAGVAQVRVARLNRKHATTGSGSRTFYAEFEQIGSMIVMYDIYERLVDGNLYRVTYSSHTKRGWAVEPYTVLEKGGV